MNYPRMYGHSFEWTKDDDGWYYFNVDDVGGVGASYEEAVQHYVYKYLGGDVLSAQFSAQFEDTEVA